MTDQLADTENTAVLSLSVDESVVGDTRKVVEKHKRLDNLLSWCCIATLSACFTC